MDSLTQAVLGAALQGAVLGRVQGRRALLYGAALATLPDMDVLIRYADPVSQMTFHRGFSHSLFVLTGLALLLTWLVLRVARTRWPHAGYTPGRLFLAFWLVLLTHPLLDAFTVYGTQLLWPLQFTPQSWAAVFIIDPIYTLSLLFGVLYAAAKGITRRSVALLSAALLFSSAYLGFGLVGREVAEQRFKAALDGQGVQVAQLRAIPMAFNSLLWRVIAKTPQGDYYEGASSLFDRAPPEWQRRSRGLELATALQGVALHERLRWFSDDWLRYDRVGDELVVTDLRMGIPGNYTFRFIMAACVDGRWAPVTPKAWPGAGVGSMSNADDLKRIFKRIFQQDPALPLAAWAMRDQEAAAPGHCTVGTRDGLVQ